MSKKKRSSRILPRNMLRLSDTTTKKLKEAGLSPRWVAKDEVFRRQDQGFVFASEVFGAKSQAEHGDQTMGSVPERHDCVLMAIEEEARQEYFEECSDIADNAESGILRTLRENMKQVGPGASIVDAKVEIRDGTKVIT